jgi:hypothetical protein
MPSRRSVLATIGVAATAGCLNRLPGIGDRGFRLGEIWVTNGHEEPRKLSLVVERDGETVYDDVLELGTTPGENKVEVEPTWPAEPARYVLTYGRPGRKTTTAELTAEDDESEDGGCMFVHVSFHPAVPTPGYSMAPAGDHPWEPGCP